MTDLGALNVAFKRATEDANRAKQAAWSAGRRLEEPLRLAWDEYRVLFTPLIQARAESGHEIPELHHEGFGDWAPEGVVESVVSDQGDGFASIYTRSNLVLSDEESPFWAGMRSTEGNRGCEARIPAIALQPGGIARLRAIAADHLHKCIHGLEPGSTAEAERLERLRMWGRKPDSRYVSPE